MDHQRMPQEALQCEVQVFKGGPVKKDLRRMELTWEATEVAALDRLEWRRCAAQYVHMDVG